MITMKAINHTTLLARRDGEIYRLSSPLDVECRCLLDGNCVRLLFHFHTGFACDGLSVPSLFRWFLPNWDLKNETYNVAGIVHDALYANRGYCVLDRDECDAVFRGILRESGKDRKHASIADWAVGAFAGSHWGNDDYHCKNLATMTIRQGWL